MSTNISSKPSSESNMNNTKVHERKTLNISADIKNVLEQSERKQSLQVATNLGASFNYAWQGFSYAFRTQRNFRIHTLIGTLALGLSLYLQIPAGDLATITLTSGAVLAMELINTALESVVDLTLGQTYDPLAKIAKDCAAAAVLVSAMVALGVAVILLLPPLLIVIKGLYL
jgi:diacylglycerol kinase (ATP)